MKKIKIENINLNVFSGKTMYVIIDVFKFSKDIGTSYMVIEIENQGRFEYLEEVNEEIEDMNFENLKEQALKWIIKNVEIV